MDDEREGKRKEKKMKMKKKVNVSVSVVVFVENDWVGEYLRQDFGVWVDYDTPHTRTQPGK